MNIIKLNAINSTNDYLKELMLAGVTETFTVVAAEVQTQGRGQMGAVWDAQAGKNLTFSVLLKDLLVSIDAVFTLNIVVALSVAETLSECEIPKVSIKWPNDILSGNKKLCGILIENKIRSDGEIESVVGIGLNVNQVDFEELPKGSSMAAIAGQVFDRDEVMLSILTRLKNNIKRLENGSTPLLWQDYHDWLFKKDVPMPFEKEGHRFMGIIKGVSDNGKLCVELENGSIADFGLKEVQLLY